MKGRTIIASAIAAALFGAASTARAIPAVVEGTGFASDVFDGDGTDSQLHAVGIVSVPGANAMRVAFSTWHLGARSRVVLRSLMDGHVQHLAAGPMEKWFVGSAFFNGDAVEVSLEVAPGDQGVFVVVAGALAEEPSPATPRSICGTTDNRVASTNPRVGRIPASDPSGCDGGLGCTAWILSNGALITAGHCGPGNGTLIEFNVPLSNADGSLNHPGPQDSYLVDGASIINANTGNLNDWSIFQVEPNTETNLLPVIAQGAFFRGTIDDQNPANARVTGFGYDDSPTGSCNWVNTHKAQQTHAGEYIGYFDNGATERFHQYRADTRAASSGSPVIIDGTTLTLGVHTNGGCAGENPEEGQNLGPSFRNTAFRGAVEAYLGANARYVDIGHPSGLQFGTVFRPYDTVASAYAAVPAGGTVYVIAGDYTAASGNATTYGGKHVVIRAPVGSVRIGN